MTYRIGYSGPALRDLRKIEEQIRAADTVMIVRILHGSRNITAKLFSQIS